MIRDLVASGNGVYLLLGLVFLSPILGIWFWWRRYWRPPKTKSRGM